MYDNCIQMSDGVGQMYDKTLYKRHETIWRLCDVFITFDTNMAACSLHMVLVHATCMPSFLAIFRCTLHKQCNQSICLSISLYIYSFLRPWTNILRDTPTRTDVHDTYSLKTMQWHTHHTHAYRHHSANHLVRSHSICTRLTETREPSRWIRQQEIHRVHVTRHALNRHLVYTLPPCRRKTQSSAMAHEVFTHVAPGVPWIHMPSIQTSQKQL